ncbi:MAG: peptidoglycan DD-metalloendopeptidase family protein [Anaerolineae bacterium]|nr:peptidoglycan DD-metalloendopeptidase family protein [Anaerolineae bacterium]
MLRRRALFLFLLCFVIPTGAVWAQSEPPRADAPQVPVHVVRATETLTNIAERYRLDLTTLMHINDLSDPRQIFPGQRLRLAPLPDGTDVFTWQSYPLHLAEGLSLAASRCGEDWETIAAANRVLNPGALLIGQSILLPQAPPSMTVAMASPDETWLTMALRQNKPYVDVVRLNPAPVYPGKPVVVPGDATFADFAPYPIVDLELTPQPVVRGQTVVLALETAEAATCVISYFDHVEPCYTYDATHLFAFVSLSPMLEPGSHSINLQLRTGDREVAFDLPLVISAGRFGYEQINVTGSLSSLMDPELLEWERNQLDAIALVRTSERRWELPLNYPVYASISSYFGSRRSYGGSYNTYHSGIDFRASTGIPVRAPAGGRVLLAEPLAVRGNAIMIDHGWGLVSGYWHLSQIDVQVGQWVTQDEVIGRVGNTGLSTGSHLHWELWVDGQPVNPLQWVETFYPFPEPPPPVVEGLE